MAECVITAGWTGPSCDDTFNVPGIEKDKIYFKQKYKIKSLYNIEGRFMAKVCWQLEISCRLQSLFLS